MKRLIYLILSIELFSCVDNKESKNILTIVAHPDDETAVGAVLAKYSNGNKIHLIIATDGRYGVTEHAGIPAGDSLIRIREAEAICSCEKLGIDSPMFLRLHDGFGMNNGIGQYFEQTTELKKVLTKRIGEINPDLIITFGPDGDTGHPDHRAIGDFVTEIILREGWYEKYPLYFMGWSKDEIDDPSLNYVDPKYLNVKVQYSEIDEEKSFESLKCHKSQFSDNDIKEWISKGRSNKANTFYFRQFNVDKKQRTDF